MSNSFPTTIQDIADKLRLISSNSKLMQPKCINLEMANLSNSVQQIAPKFSAGEIDYHRDKFSSELADISYEIDRVFQFISTARDVHKVASELKAIRTKLEKISKKLQSNINYAKEDTTMKMTLKNTPIETLTISDKREDKENIITLLLQSEPCIVPIIHKYKPNSTEFARAIFEDKRVCNHFSRAVWMDAPHLIVVKKLKKLAKRRPSTLFWAIKTLNKDLEVKRVLLVFDDIKKELEPGTWDIRDYPLMNNRDKKVIGTSKTRNVSDATWTFKGLEKLSVKEAWKVIKAGIDTRNLSDVTWSFKGSEKLGVEEAWKVIKGGIDIKKMEVYEGIGKEILSKMERWGSTVETLRDVLSSNMEVAYWKMMVKSQFWRIPCHDNHLSYLVWFCYNFRARRW